MSDGLASALDERLGAAYTIERELEGGGMSRVFVAHERALGRRVVIKVLSSTQQNVDAERFRQEILTSARLQHPHIIPVHSAGDVDGSPYFVMPFANGESLRARLLRDRTLPLGEGIRVLRDIAAALHHAHAQGIVHRDLKPENVMLSGGSAIVLDFGVAKALAAGGAAAGSRGTLTNPGWAVGTPRYMAPEQAAADPALDHRADIYAFGVIAFELFAGDAPFKGTPSEVLRQHIAAPPPDLAALVPLLPRTIVELVRACLAKAPEERPSDAARLLDALDGVGTPLTGTQVGGETRSRPRIQRRWLAVFIVPGVYAATAGGAVAYLFHLAAEERVREGIAAAGVIGALLGFPLAIAAGLLVRVAAQERAQ